jgi:transposase InsO family protein
MRRRPQVGLSRAICWISWRISASSWDRIRDRDGRFGVEFDRRVQRLGITRIRTPVRVPRANALAERWIGSARRECLDHVVIIIERHLRQVLDE